MEIFAKPFGSMDVTPLYRMLQLRSQVFVVEQTCIYQDLDGTDLRSWHIWACEGADVIGCARVFMRDGDEVCTAPNSGEGTAGVVCSDDVDINAFVGPGIAQIGRVVTAETHRHRGVASLVMRKAMEVARIQLGARQIYLEAQTYAIPLYSALGFKVVSGEFLEDGIPHVQMLCDVGDE